MIGEHDATIAYTTSPPYQEKSARLDYVYARGTMRLTASGGVWLDFVDIWFCLKAHSLEHHKGELAGIGWKTYNSYWLVIG